MFPLKLMVLVSAVAYLIVRVGFTWHDSNPVLFGFLLAAEMFGMWRLWVEISLIRRIPDEHSRPEIESSKRADAVVVVTDEPTSEVRAAVLSAKTISGIGRVTVIDRDDRFDVAELSDRLNVRRLAGTPDCDVGQLVDIALADSDEELTVMLPADVVVLSDIVALTAPEFADPDLAVVLCRVDHANAGESNSDRYGENARRAELVSVGLVKRKTLPWFSGVSVMRQAMVLSCGGLSSAGKRRNRSGATLEAGLRLQQADYLVAAATPVLARRLASWNEDRHLHRWARELHERLIVLDSPHIKRKNIKLPRIGRRVYTAVRIQTLMPIQRAVLIGVLMATLYTPWLPLTGEIVPLLLLWGAWHATSLVVRISATREIREGDKADDGGSDRKTRFVPWIVRDLRFMATNLVVARRVRRGSRSEPELADRAPGRALRAVLLSAIGLSMLASLAVFGSGVLTVEHADFAKAATLSFTVWFLGATVLSWWQSRGRQSRRSYRTFENLRVIDGASEFAVVGVSPSGVDVVTKNFMEKGDSVRIAFDLPQADGQSVKFESSTVVQRSSRQGRRHTAYMRFSMLSDEQFDQIVSYCSVIGAKGLLRAAGGEVFDEVSSAEIVESPEPDPSRAAASGAEAVSEPGPKEGADQS